jgi:hypothetical protein
MQVETLAATRDLGWRRDRPIGSADLVVYFGDRALVAGGAVRRSLKSLYPDAVVIGCTTGGQFGGNALVDGGAVAAAVKFAGTRIRLECATTGQMDASRACGRALGKSLAAPDLTGLFVLSDGLRVNGTALIAGMSEATGPDVCMAGGLAGDGSDFSLTLVDADDEPQPGTVAAIGFYGDRIRFGTGSAGGWDVFGPRRRITRAEGNILYELDGEPALALYERYLGDEAAGMPGTALLFPLSVRDPAEPGRAVVRTVLGIDRIKGSMTFAGDMPMGHTAQLMRGQFDRLANSAGDAARQALVAVNGDSLSIFISCIGRKLLMGQRTAEEIAAARRAIGPTAAAIGFYSYGEISTDAATRRRELHNQTMTVFSFGEA